MRMRLITMLFAALTCSAYVCPAAPDKDSDWAVTATDVAVTLNSAKVTGGADVQRLRPVSGSYFGGGSGKGSASKGEDKEARDTKEIWYAVNIPLRINTRGRNSANQYVPARYVPELAVKVTLLVRKPKEKLKGLRERSATQREKESYYILTKEMTYVDIPMKKMVTNSAGKKVGESEVVIGVFLPRAAVYAMTGDFSDPDDLLATGVIAGYAVEATFGGEPCREIEMRGKAQRPGETPCSVLFSNKLAAEVRTRKWWSTSKSLFETPQGARLYSIAETPYAPFYAADYPRLKSVFGEAEPAPAKTTEPPLGTPDPHGSADDPSETRRGSTRKPDGRPSVKTEGDDTDIENE